MSEWMHEEGALDAELAFVGAVGSRARSVVRSEAQDLAPDNLAVFLKPLVVQNTRKWFGDADLRLDVLVSQAGGEAGDLFQTRTFRFPRVADGDDLANSENGLMVYFGRPKHFLALTVTLARDTGDSDTLAELIQKQSRSTEVSGVLTTLAAAAASPHVAAVKAAMEAALTLGDLAYRLVREVSPRTLGLYRTNWLANKDNFGIGRHPAAGALSIKDFQLAYQIVADRAEP